MRSSIGRALVSKTKGCKFESYRMCQFNKMGKLLIRLNQQLKTENKKEAEDCLKIYNELKRMTGYVWQREWDTFVNTTFIGTYPNAKHVFTPSGIGYIFLKGLTNHE